MSSYVKRDDESHPHQQDPNFTPNAVRAIEPNPVEQPLTATEARQGQRGYPVLIMLIAGLALAIIAWGGAEWWGQATAPPPEQTATPPASSSTAPANPDAKPSSTP